MRFAVVKLMGFGALGFVLGVSCGLFIFDGVDENSAGSVLATIERESSREPNNGEGDVRLTNEAGVVGRFVTELDELDNENLESIFSGLGESDPFRGLELISGLPSIEKGRALSALVLAWVKTDREGAWDWIADPDNEFGASGHIYSSAAKAMVGVAPVECMTYVERIGAIQQRVFLESYIDEISDGHIAEMATVFSGLNEYVRENTVKSLVGKWSLVDLDLCVSWISDQEFSERVTRSAYAGVVRGIASVDPRFAYEWASGLGKNVKSGALRTSIRSWVDQGGASELVEEVVASDASVRSDLVKVSLAIVAQSDPRSAISMVESIEETVGVGALRGRAFAFFAESDRVKALEWLETQHEKEDYADLVGKMAIRDANYLGAKSFEHMDLLSNREERMRLADLLSFELMRESSQVSIEEVEALEVLSYEELEFIKNRMERLRR